MAMGGLAGLMQQYGASTGKNIITGAPLGSAGSSAVGVGGGGFGGIANALQGGIGLAPASAALSQTSPSISPDSVNGSPYLNFLNALHPIHRQGLIGAFSSYPDFQHLFSNPDIPTSDPTALG